MDRSVAPAVASGGNVVVTVLPSVFADLAARLQRVVC
jgi:hypothetical protein